jgi:hypothetical protein
VGLIIVTGLFVPYEDWTIYVSDVTGSTTKVNHWFWIFDTRKITDSPLRVWCQKHNVPMQEKDRFLAHDTFSIVSRTFACGFGTAAGGLPGSFQKIYIEHETEANIGAYVSAMMAAPDEATRRKLVSTASARVIEWTDFNRQK